MEIKKDAWNNFIKNAMDGESNDSNFKVTFKVLSKKYGRAYIVFCKAMWEANDGVMTENEFIKMNGEMPKPFFDKVIKGV